jgi:hypothetical protein
MLLHRERFQTRLGHILCEVRDNFDSIRTFGVFWINDSLWICNSDVLALALRIKRNSLVADLRDHGFKTESSIQYRHLLKGFGTCQNCKVHGHPLVLRQTVERDMERIPYMHSLSGRKQPKREEQERKEESDRPELPSDFPRLDVKSAPPDETYELKLVLQRKTKGRGPFSMGRDSIILAQVGFVAGGLQLGSNLTSRKR